MKLWSMGHALDGLNVATLGVETKHQTRKNRTPVDEHGASAAFAELTAVLRASEIQILTQNFEQRLMRCEGDLSLFAVEGEMDMLLTVERQRLSSSLYSKSGCRSVAFCRHTRRQR